MMGRRLASEAQGSRGKRILTPNEREWQSSGGQRFEPYGIVASKHVIRYSEFGTKPNTVVPFDPKSQNFQTWVIPPGWLHRALIDVTPDATPVLATSTVNGVVLVEVK